MLLVLLLLHTIVFVVIPTSYSIILCVFNTIIQVFHCKRPSREPRCNPSTIDNDQVMQMQWAKKDQDSLLFIFLNMSGTGGVVYCYSILLDLKVLLKCIHQPIFMCIITVQVSQRKKPSRQPRLNHKYNFQHSSYSDAMRHCNDTQANSQCPSAQDAGYQATKSTKMPEYHKCHRANHICSNANRSTIATFTFT